MTAVERRGRSMPPEPVLMEKDVTRGSESMRGVEEYGWRERRAGALFKHILKIV
jgi:hypothetical protein